MEKIVPYAVLVGVSIAFFLVCLLCFGKKGKPKKKAIDMNIDITKDIPVTKEREYVDYAALYYRAEEKQEQGLLQPGMDRTSLAKTSKMATIKPTSREAKSAIYETTMSLPTASEQEGSEMANRSESQAYTAMDTMHIPTVQDDMTLMMPSVSTEVMNEDTHPMPVTAEEEATRVLPVVGKGALRDMMSQSTDISNTTYNSDTDILYDVPGLKNFVRVHGYVSAEVQRHVKDITEEAISQLEAQHIMVNEALLSNIVIQEALLCMQKAYCATPTDWLKAVAIECFCHIVTEPKSSTTYLIAYDALHILPHLTLGHLQAMSLVLLLKYSRNTNNFKLEKFRHYVRKYIEPFMTDLPRNGDLYRQLDYLRCTVTEQNRENFTTVLSQAYPFVFNYLGFTIDELKSVVDTNYLKPPFIVPSINSNLFKLAIVDESMAQNFFRKASIQDISVQQSLLYLMKSKPTVFEGHEAKDILMDISPTLVDLGKVFDMTPMSRVSLTFLGLYLARAHVKAVINEDFDLSGWF